MEDKVFDILDNVLRALENGKKSTLRDITKLLNRDKQEAQQFIDILEGEGYLKPLTIPKNEENPEMFGIIDAWEITIKGKIFIMNGGYHDRNKDKIRSQNFQRVVSISTITIATLALITFILKICKIL